MQGWCFFENERNLYLDQADFHVVETSVHLNCQEKICLKATTNEPRHEKTNDLHMRKQRRRSASR